MCVCVFGPCPGPGLGKSFHARVSRKTSSVFCAEHAVVAVVAANHRQSETYQLGSDGAPIWPAQPIPGEDENLITSKSTLHLAAFPPVRFVIHKLHTDHWKDCYHGHGTDSNQRFDDGEQTALESRFVPFGQHEDDEMPIDTFEGQGECPCGRVLPMMATCGYCLMLAG